MRKLLSKLKEYKKLFYQQQYKKTVDFYRKAARLNVKAVGALRINGPKEYV